MNKKINGGEGIRRIPISKQRKNEGNPKSPLEGCSDNHGSQDLPVFTKYKEKQCICSLKHILENKYLLITKE